MNCTNYILAVFALTLTSCAGVKNVPFTVDSWSVNTTSGNIENTDSSYSFTLCSDVIEPELPLIGSDFETYKYKGLKSYLNKVCSRLEVRCDSILFYAPTKRLMIVEIAETNQWKPRSQHVNLLGDNPYTAWVRDDYVEEWQRTPGEIYTNVILDEKAKQLLIVDRLTYKKRDIAIIHIIQTDTKKFRSIGLPAWSGTWADVTDPTCLEPISNWIEGHRKFAIENYRLGVRK